MAFWEHDAVKNFVDRLHKLFKQVDHLSFGALGILRTAIRRQLLPQVYFPAVDPALLALIADS